MKSEADWTNPLQAVCRAVKSFSENQPLTARTLQCREKAVEIRGEERMAAMSADSRETLFYLYQVYAGFAHSIESRRS